MARKSTPDRLQRLIEAATDVFIYAGGYRRAQMADVARALAVSPGTLYLYVESKEALFDLVIRRADLEGPVQRPSALPVPTPAPGATLTYIRERLEREVTFPALEAALAREEVDDPSSELEAIVRELYGRLFQHRRGIKVADASAPDYPELAALWYEKARGSLMLPLMQYLERRIGQGSFRAVPDVAIAARMALEICVMWAVHRHWDPHPQPMDETQAREVAVQFVVRALTPDRPAVEKPSEPRT